jgi:nucleoside 2-deoxyribosyltransferase
MDPGSLFEIGFARALEKPVIVYCTSEDSPHLTMVKGSGCRVFANYVKAIYEAAWI